MVPKYYFHIRSPDSFIEDEVGVDLLDLDHVRREARQGARDIMAEDLKAGRIVDHQSFEVMDERGELVLVVVFRDMLRSPPP